MTMAIDSELVRDLRGEWNWSQEDLAAAAGISARTVQRVETDGRASLETRKALAAAFDIRAESLGTFARFNGAKWGVRFGIGGATLGYLSAAAATVYALAQGQLSGAEAGAMLGFLGAATGLTCALIGWLGNRFRTS